MHARGTHLRLIPSSASPEEAAAIVAALERFRRATAAAPPARQPADGWRRVAMLEAVERGGEAAPFDPWINT